MFDSSYQHLDREKMRDFYEREKDELLNIFSCEILISFRVSHTDVINFIYEIDSVELIKKQYCACLMFGFSDHLDKWIEFPPALTV